MYAATWWPMIVNKLYSALQCSILNERKEIEDQNPCIHMGDQFSQVIQAVIKKQQLKLQFDVRKAKS